MGVLKFLDPIKDYIYAAIAIAVIVCGVWYVHHERAIGQAKLAADIALNEIKWQAQVDKVQQDAAREIGRLKGKLELASITPPPNPSHVRVCPSTGGQTGTVRPGPASGSGSDGPRRPGEPVADDGAGSDIGPPTELLLTQLKAQIEYLQGYIRVCQTAGVCEK